MSVRKRVQAPKPGSAPDQDSQDVGAPHGGGRDDDDEDSCEAFTAVLERFVRPLKDECTDFENTFCASFLKQADALASSRAILEAFICPVRELLGRNILDGLTDTRHRRAGYT